MLDEAHTLLRKSNNPAMKSKVLKIYVLFGAIDTQAHPAKTDSDATQ